MNFNQIIERFNFVRAHTREICKNLSIEDYVAQPATEVSPPKWHIGHTTWFFEQFVLCPKKKGYEVYNKEFAYLFNSYYNNVGERVIKTNRGLLTRPCVEEIYKYRSYVEDAMNALTEEEAKEVLHIIELGISHEEQHHELLAYDIKYILGHQPMFVPIQMPFALETEKQKEEFIAIEEGVYEVGYDGTGFCHDNELGRHKVYIHPFSISNRQVTNKEYKEFILAGGYKDFNLWHAEGWDYINKHKICAPMYWHEVKGVWKSYSYNGFNDIIDDEPVCNVSFYEAFAYANWKGMRLPTEFEWEVASTKFNWGKVWDWTNSAYLPYPGYKKEEGAIGEYNGKFMVNSHVLKGASYVTTPQHSRASYRNFFHPESRWQFSGIRLAK